jgi:transposase
MRKGMPGLTLLVQEHFKRDPFAGDVFVLRRGGGSLIKAIWHDGLGLSLYAKRLDRGRADADACPRADLWSDPGGGYDALYRGGRSPGDIR